MSTTAENSIATDRVVGRPFAKGVSGNPGGRPKGLASYVREQTLDGEELVDFHLRVRKGEEVNGRRFTTDQMMEAARWLGDRGWGKAIQQSVVETHQNRLDSSIFADMTIEEIQAYRAELVKTLEVEQALEAQRALPEAQVIDGEASETAVVEAAADI